MTTEQGNQHSGLGIIQWWGLSPAVDLSEVILKDDNPDEVNILLVGAGDIRHILLTLSRLNRHHNLKKVNFYIWENRVEIYARQILPLLAISEPSSAYNINTKVGLYLDIFGNSMNRPFTQKYITQKATVMSEMVTDLSYGKERASFLDLSELKFKDRDLINDQCCFWRSKDEFKIQEQWDIRSRQYLGARYDHRSGDYDWKLSMRYNELQASVITKHHYNRFRDVGVSFEPLEEGSYTCPNKSLSSSRVLANGRGDKNAFRGFWGDIIVGPFVCHGIESENEKLFKLQNKLPTHGSDEISKWNIHAALHELFHGEKFDGEANSQIELVDEDDDKHVSTDLVKRKELYSSVKMDKSSVTFLSPTNFDKLYNSSKYNSKFDLVFLSVSNSKKIDQNLPLCLKPNGLVVAETAKYVLDLKKEQQETHLNAVKQMAKDCGFSERGFSNVLSSKMIFKRNSGD